MKDNIKIPNWLKEKYKDLIDSYVLNNIIEFDQTWGSTALGFYGCAGGDMMTDATTTVLLLTDHISCRELCAVFFGGSFAYLIEKDGAVENCIKDKNFPDTHEADIIFKKVETKRDRT